MLEPLDDPRFTEDRPEQKPKKNSSLSAIGVVALGLLVTATPLLNLLRKSGEDHSSPPNSSDVPAATSVAKPILTWHQETSPNLYSPQRESHFVKKGETLESIASKFGVRPEQIKSQNNRYGANADKLQIGTCLSIPAVRGAAVDSNNCWRGKVFDLDLASKADWVYMCQNLICCQDSQTPMRDALTSATQYMPSSLRRAFISKMCATLHEISEDEILLSKRNGVDLSMPYYVRANWAEREPAAVQKLQQRASAYAWALEAAITQRSSAPVKGEDAIREIIPHPFRLSPDALISSIDNLRVLEILKIQPCVPKSAGCRFAELSLSFLTGHASLDLEGIKSGKAKYLLMNVGVSDHNGAFDSADHVFQGAKAARIPVVYQESFDANDMLNICNDVVRRAGRSSSSLVLGGHGNISKSGCILQVGYNAWAFGTNGANYYLNSMRHSSQIPKLASESILFLSCDSGAKPLGGDSFVDGVAIAAKQERRYGLSIYGLKVPSNLYALTVNADGSIEPRIGRDGKDGVRRVVKKEEGARLPPPQTKKSNKKTSKI